MGFTGCRTKCEEGSSAWPECAEGDATPPPNTRTLWVWNLHDPKDAFTGQFQAFPNVVPGIEPGLNVEYRQFTNPYEYEKLLMSEIAQGQGPAVFAIDPSWLTKYPDLFAPMPVDLLSDIPAGAETDTTDPTAKLDAIFFPIVREHLTRDGDVYALPMYVDTLALYFNSNIFSNAIFNSITDNKPAETWEGIKEQTKEMTEKDKSIERFRLTAIALGRADNIRLAADIVKMLFLQHGAALFDSQAGNAIIAEAQGTVSGTGREYFPGIEAMKLFTGFADATNITYNWNRLITALYPQLDEIGAFARGKTAMIFGYSSTYNDIVATIEGLSKNRVDTIKVEDIDVAPAPQLDGFGSEGQVALGKMYPFAVNKNLLNTRPILVDDGWQLIKYLTTDPEVVRGYQRQTRKPSALRSLNPEQQSEQLYGVFARQVPFADLVDVISPEDFERILQNALKELEIQELEESVMPAMQARLQCLFDQSIDQRQDTDCPSIRP
mgnify:CR=1 FL=1